MHAHYTSDVLFEGSYYVASVTEEGKERQSVYFSSEKRANSFCKELEDEYPYEVFIVVDTMSEEQ